MGRPLYTNNAASALAAGITSTQTTIQVQDGMGSLFPTPVGGDYFYITVTSISLGGAYEIMQCTARTNDVMTVVRGAEGTSAQAFNIGDNVQLRITAAGMNFLTGQAVTSTEQEAQTATQGQTVFTLVNFDYAPGTNNLAVFVNGSKQVSGVNYSETSVNTVTFNTGLNAGDIVEFLVGVSVASGTLFANDVQYNEGSTGAVTRTVEKKLQESISVADFGAVGDGTTDDTAAIQAAINTGFIVNFVNDKTYKITAPLTGTSVYIRGNRSTIKVYGDVNAFNVSAYCHFYDLTIQNQESPLTANNSGISGAIYGSTFENVYISYFKVGFDFTTNSYLLALYKCTAYNCMTGFKNYSSGTAATTTVFDSCYALCCGTGFYLYGISDGEMRNCAIDIGVGDYAVPCTIAVYGQYIGGFTITSTHIEGLPNSTYYNCFDLNLITGTVNILSTSFDIYENSITTRLFYMSGYSSPYGRVNIIGNRQIPKTTMPAIVRYSMRTDIAGYKLYVDSTDNSFIDTNCTIRLGGEGAGNQGESWITENNTLEQVPKLYKLTGVSSGALQQAPASSFISVVTTTGQTTVSSGVAATMFTISDTGAYYVYAWIGASGSSYQSVSLVTSDGISANAASLKSGANMVISTSGLNVQITTPAAGSINYSYLKVA